jgi:malonyl-CoA/methylmalonyl-CoA synthetase
MNLYSRLAHGFPSDRRRPCFLVEGRTISYGELETGAARAAGLLRSRGVTPGDRVLVQAPKSPEVVMIYLGALMAGAIFVPLNTAYTETEVGYFVADAEPAIFVRDAQGFMTEATGCAPISQAELRAPDDLAAMIYTSGTTGKPKGAMLTHGGLIANAEALTKLWEFGESDVLLHALPIFHVHGLFVALHCALLAGCPVLWFDRFDAAEVVAALPRATVMMGVPTFYTRLLAEPGFTSDVASGMRLFISGSAPMLDSTFHEFRERTGHSILERYGMSEAAIITSNPTRGERRAGSVGYPLPGFEVRIAGEAPGMIEIRGPSLFKGYWGMPEKTAQEFTADGFFVTGDIGHQDPDGRLYISGRSKDLIISGGYNVYPKEIELVLDELPGVEESAVIGVPHPDFGEAVVAVVAGRISEQELISQARRKLAAFKAPKRVFLVDELPRNAMGKVQKAELRKIYDGLFTIATEGAS